jgi:hypothetical protein
VTRRSYNEIARIISETEMPEEVRDELVARLSTTFADDNPRFDPARFRAACQPGVNP